ncbi:Disease resistance protein RGA2 [Morella rubra]|uniref:Disease resistance protein RGA2 n=1 Tax=Morella rubra TaxID=262757 RepID=A0A6A1WJG1_9ROSI|nr:Disease resistance protein RGA2 [Morella rubra]
MSSSSSSSSSSGQAPFFPSLDEIFLSECPNLKGWWGRREFSVIITSDDDESFEMNTETLVMDHHLLLSFLRLSTLRISGCPMLTSMPTFPSVKDKLKLQNVSFKQLQQTMTMKKQAIASSSTLVAAPTRLSKLKRLTLGRIGDLETLLEEWLRNLTSLESLHIGDCNRLKSLSQGIQHLSALQDLHLHDCDALDVCNDEDGMQWQGLKSFLSLEFEGLPKLVSLPLGLQHVSTLQKLFIHQCNNFMAIPEWIDNCTSLVHLAIQACPSLTSLPEGMHGLASFAMTSD